MTSQRQTLYFRPSAGWRPGKPNPWSSPARSQFRPVTMQLAVGFLTQQSRPGALTSGRVTLSSSAGASLVTCTWMAQLKAFWVFCKQHDHWAIVCTSVANSGMDMDMCLGAGMGSTASRSTCSRTRP